MGDPRLAALDIAMPRIARTLQELQERVQALEGGQDPEEAARDRVRGLWKGVWQGDGTRYPRGALVTHRGGLWHANEDTDARPGTGEGWTLAVKSGAAPSLQED
jgi:hypothetical protein